MAASSAFPLKLLGQSTAERLDYFRCYTVRHPRLEEMDARLWRLIHAQIGAPLIFIFGPPGVGKTTLCGRIHQRLVRQAATDAGAEWKGGAIVLETEAIAPENGNFNWRDFYQRSLSALEGPFVNDPAREPLPSINPRLAHALTFNPRLPHCEFRLALEHALKFRRPAAFLIDDAQHIAKIASGRRLQDQMDVLKSLASKSKTTLMLLGTYELLNFRNLSGQLSRRSIDLHFRRYRTSAEDLKAFHSALWAFQRHLPLTIEPELMKHWEYCYAHSIGCVGILKDWLTRSLYEALETNARSITIKMLEQHALSIDQCETLATEAIEGEARLSNGGGSPAKLMRLLGLDKSSMRGMPIPVEAQSEEALLKTPVKLKPHLPRTVGRRKPHRDAVGKR